MIKLPDQQFRETVIDEGDPFVKNALRNRKHYELCWCGSNKKFKKCHRLREQESPYVPGQILSNHKKVFWRKRECMHPLASSATCSGDVIDSHSIQRKGPLEKIIDTTGHVMHFEFKSNDGDVNVAKIGWRKASIFPGYCSGHDARLFDPIENGEFTGEHSHCVLQAFRNICSELYRKRASIEVFEDQRTFIDRGCDLNRQIELQFGYNKSIEGYKKSIEEMELFREKFEAAIIQKDYSEFESKCYFFQGDLNVVSSSVFQCGFDFDGNKLIDMWDTNLDAEMLSHSVMNTDDGGAIVFVWLKHDGDPSTVVSSFKNVPDDEKSDIFVQYCFLNCENTFFSKLWWDNLSNNEQTLIKKYANTFYYEGGKYSANTNRLVDWIIV